MWQIAARQFVAVVGRVFAATIFWAMENSPLNSDSAPGEDFIYGICHNRYGK